MTFFEIYKESTNVNFLTVFIISSSFILLKLIISFSNYNFNDKNIIKSLGYFLTNIIIQTFFIFLSLSIIIYLITKLFNSSNLSLDNLKYLITSSSNILDLLKNEWQYIMSNFNKNLDSFAKYIPIYSMSFLLGFGSFFYFLNTYIKDEKKLISIIQFTFYFFIVISILYYVNIDPIEVKLNLVQEGCQFYVEEIRNERIFLYTANLPQIRNNCFLLISAISYLFAYIIDDWLIINEYRTLTNNFISRWNKLRIVTVNYVILVLTFLVFNLTSYSSYRAGIYNLANLASKPIPYALENYQSWSFIFEGLLNPITSITTIIYIFYFISLCFFNLEFFDILFQWIGIGFRTILKSDKDQ